MDSHSIQHIETGNKKILYSIQYTNASLINQSQNVNIVTYEAVEIPDVITVRSSSCEYLNTVTHDANVSDVLFEENNVVNYTTEILHQQKHESDVSELLFEENNDGQYTTEALHQQKPESNVSGLLLENNNVVTYTTEIIQPQKEQNLSVDLFGEMSCSDSDTTVPAKKNKKKKRIKELKAIPLDERKTRGRKLKVPNQTRAQRKKNVNTNKPYINSKVMLH